MADAPSRLSSGMINVNGIVVPIEEFRNNIFARSLYSLDNEYQNTNKFSLRNKGNVASGIATVLAVVPQYNRIQTNTNLLGNVYDAFRDDSSALARIGLVMLGKQMAYNSAMNLSIKYIPSVDVSQALKGGKLFNLNKDNTITVEDKSNKSFGDKVSSFASNFLGIDTYNVFGNGNPFSKNPTNDDYIKNTGNIQLSRFYNAINYNIYKPINEDNYVLLTEYSGNKKAGVPIKSQNDVVNRNNLTFFDYSRKARPYYTKANYGTVTATVPANNDMLSTYSGTTMQEYAPTYQYVLDNFGQVVKSTSRKDIINNYVPDEANLQTNNNEQRLVWGRDGVADEALAYVEQLQGDDDLANKKPIPFSDLNIHSGLLAYTKNLLNASGGQFVDITRKAFKSNNTDFVGFNGSPLWTGNDSIYAKTPNDPLEPNNINAGKTGVRQHSALDKYDRFAKLIRFKGNVVYEGNPNSVIYNRVIPRVHPTNDEKGILNNKNLMFSLENLAVGTIARDNYGVIDDEYGTAIPLSEVGPFAGRMMWFPPYGLEINETAIAKFESTVMVGRNEPMYNYMNSERTAVLNFTLLIDYPEQLRNLKLTGANKNKAIADFFAFGGDPLPATYRIEEFERETERLKSEIPKESGPVDPAEPPDPQIPDVKIYFQNDVPDENQVDTAIDIMYKNSNHWEIISDMQSAQDGNGFGLNKDIYFISGITGTTKNDWGLDDSQAPSQYTSIGVNNQTTNNQPIPICLLNKNLLDAFTNVENRKYFSIYIEGAASKLYLNKNQEEYNRKLGNRRIQAATKLVRSKLKLMFPEITDTDIEIVAIENIGSSQSGQLGADPAKMFEKEVKEERHAMIRIKRNNVSPEKIVQKLNQQQIDNIAQLQQQIQNLEGKVFEMKKLKNNIDDNILKERNKAILDGFEAHSGGFYSPTYHSQTPEDFHKRLTFLQQCTRQGAANRYDNIDENGGYRARNSVFGRQPICILRVADFFYTKVIIESVTIDYAETTWDMNPEGFGMQPMIAKITLQMKVIGGQSLKGPIDALQNAVTFNYYANSNYTDRGMYARPSAEATAQDQYIHGVDGTSGIVGEKQNNLKTAYEKTAAYKLREGDK